MDDSHACKLLQVFFEYHQSRVMAVRSERGDFPDSKRMAVFVRRARDVDGIGKEIGEESGFLVNSSIQRRGNQDLGESWRIGREESWELGCECFGREVEIRACGRLDRTRRSLRGSPYLRGVLGLGGLHFIFIACGVNHAVSILFHFAGRLVLRFRRRLIFFQFLTLQPFNIDGYA